MAWVLIRKSLTGAVFSVYYLIISSTMRGRSWADGLHRPFYLIRL